MAQKFPVITGKSPEVSYNFVFRFNVGYIDERQSCAPRTN